MTLRSRLALALVTIAAILVAPLFIAYDSLNSMRAAVRNIQGQDLNATLLLARIRTAAEELRQAELQMVYATDSSTGASPDPRLTTAVTALRALSDSLVTYGLSASRSIDRRGRRRDDSRDLCRQGRAGRGAGGVLRSNGMPLMARPNSDEQQPATPRVDGRTHDPSDREI